MRRAQPGGACMPHVASGAYRRTQFLHLSRRMTFERFVLMKWACAVGAILTLAGCTNGLPGQPAEADSVGHVGEQHQAISGTNLAGPNLGGANLGGSNLGGNNLAGPNLGGNN